MKKITSKKKYLFLFVGTLLLFSFSGKSQTQFHQATFEAGNDGWTLTDASRDNNSSYAYAGSYSLRMDDSSGEFRSPTFALSAYDKVDIRFYMTNRGLDDGETVTVEYRENNSASWTTVGVLTGGNIVDKDSDFEDGDDSSTKYAKTMTIFASDVTFPAATTAEFRFLCGADSSSDDVHIDNITLTGTTFNTISTGPGGVTSNLELWLQADKVDGSGVIADNSSLNSWQDTGKGNDANTVVSTQAPTYKNNVTDNINFNPVIDFSNSSATSSSDMTYMTARDELSGTGGFYSHDMFVVVIPDEPITTTMIPLDTFTGKNPAGTTAQEDVTGFGYGAYTNRFVNEYFAYCIGTTSGPGNGYGKGDLTFGVDLNQVGIVNIRHNATSGATGQNVYFNNIDIGDSESDAAAFAEVSNQRYFLGRSQYWNGSFGGRIAEVVTYSATNTDASMTDNKNRILSYLAIKYGITLGTNGTSQDYVDSSGNVIWDQSTDAAAFNYDIAGIGRSDAAGMMQRQSKSINSNTMVTMGITEIADTNSDNSNNIPIDESYLVWGNDNGSLAAAPTINVDMSAGISGLSTMVDFTSVSRTWKVVETGGDVPTVTVSVPETSLSATLTPPGSYLMFISSTPSFSPTSEYRVMTLNGANLEATYDFTGTQYITFGYAPQYEYERSITFDGTQDYLDADDIADLTGSFTISAWVKHDGTGGVREIVSKRNNPFTRGYSLRLTGTDRPSMVWTSPASIPQYLTAPVSVAIPANEWHHIAATFDGTNAILYVDGVEARRTNSFSAPTGNSEHLLVGAANYLSPVNYMDGTIDEVRIWSRDLSEDQLRYIMNQEIQEHTDTTVDGQILPQDIWLNEVESLAWPDLIVYYPMNFYTFTNVNDNSGNNNVAAIRNLDTVDNQTAPLPYESVSNGDYDDVNTWSNGSLQYVPGSLSLVDGVTTIDWNIVDVGHQVSMDENNIVLGVLVDSSGELIIDGDNKIEITHYLDLDGKIDLEGESQLVQTQGSTLELTSAGTLEKDQQGTADMYTYNYWSSPVSKRNPYRINRDYNLTHVLNDGTDTETPVPVAWTDGLNGSDSPVTISTYWLYKYANLTIGDYSAWQYLGRYGMLSPGEGFTMKGPGSGNVGDEQNYTFIGKPNNYDLEYRIRLFVNAGNNYLVGNPFPSALDANDFITENPHLDGTLYFWEHWGGGSHDLYEYQGGYAMYNLSGGTVAMRHPDLGGGGPGNIIPKRYIPVGQGFFVAADSDGNIEFNNSQRNFVVEGGSSVFTFTDDGSAAMKTTGDDPSGDPVIIDDTYYDAPDTRTKLRIGFDSPKGYHRQLLLTFDDNTTMGHDSGYDGKIFFEQVEDMNFLIEEDKYAIQGIPVVDGNASVTLPLSVKTDEFGEIVIGLDALENDNEKLYPYLHDKATNTFVNLREDYFTVLLDPGVYDTRFEIVLRKTERQRDVINTEKALTVGALHSKMNQQVTVFSKDTEVTINAVTVYSILGQQVGSFQFDGRSSEVYFESTNFSTGTYILKIQTGAEVQTTKIIIDK